MKSAERSKAEDKYAELKKRDVSILTDIEKASKARAEKSAKLRELRLQKEAEDRETGKGSTKKPAKAKAERTKTKQKA